MSDERDDPDRDAILTRRRRMVAIALSGLTTVAACADPRPCLSVAPIDPSPPGQTNDGPQLPEEGEPQACLSVAVPEEEDRPTDDDDELVDPVPQPCLSVARPPSEREE